MMTDVKVVLDWANAVCLQALTEARRGDTTLANRMGANSSMKLFFDNVHGTRQVKDTEFAAYWPNQFKEIARLYEDYTRDEEIHQQVDKISALEAKMDELAALVGKLVEAQAQPVVAEEAAPVKKTSKKAAKAETEEPAVEDEKPVEAEPEA